MAENRSVETQGLTGPEVSVVMPVYNGERTIREAVRSVFSQQVSLELIVVNDCSRDGTEKILEEFCADPRLRVIRNQSSLGAAGSRNAGVAAARGDYVAYLDADDIWADGKLEKQLALVKKTGAVLCCTGRELMSPDGTLTGRVIGVREKIDYSYLLRHNSINCSSVLIRTDAAREFPMEHEDSHEDYITWLKVLRKYNTAVGIDEPLLRYRLSASGKSGSKLHSAVMTFRVYRYMGFGPVRSVLCFISYAFHGVWKYLRAWMHRK